MITFYNEKNEIFLAQGEIKESKGVNGEKSLTGTIYFGDDVINNIDRGWRLDFNDERYAVIYAVPNDKGKTVSVEFDAVHDFFFSFSKSVIHEEWTGSHTFESYLGLLFDGTDYTYNLELNVPAIEKDSFGLKNRLSLFNEIVSDSGVEFTINGNIVRIVEKTGTDLSTIVQKGFNMQELKLEKNLSGFITYMKGYGAYVDDDDHTKGRLEVEYKSPLADTYGVLEGDPLVDERYSVADNMAAKIKGTVENSYEISVELTMADLHSAGYDYESPHEGDYLMAINEDLGFQKKIRIISYVSSYDVNGNLIGHDVTCDSTGVVASTSSSSTLSAKVEQALAQSELANSNAASALKSADGKTLLFFTENSTDPDPIGKNKGDTWYKTVGDVTTIYYWTGTEWRLDPAETVAQRVSEAVEANEKIVNDAMAQSKTATELAQEANATAEKNNNTVAEIQQKMQSQTAEVEQKFLDANADISDLQQELKDTQADSEQKANDATSKIEAAQQALTALADSKGAFVAWCDDLESYGGFTTINPALAQELAITVDGVETKGSYDLARMTQEDFLALIAGTVEESDVVSNAKYVGFSSTASDNPADYNWILSANYLDDTVKVEVKKLSDRLEQSVSKTTFNELKGTVETQETSIEETKEAITHLATNEVVDTLQQRVTDTETSTKQTAQALTDKADKTTVNELTGDVENYHSEQTQTAETVKTVLAKTDENEQSILKVQGDVESFNITLTTLKNRGAYIAYCNDDKTYTDFTTDDFNAKQTLSITVDGSETSGDYDVRTLSQTEFLAIINGEMTEDEAGNGYRYVGFSAEKDADPSEYTWMLSSDFVQSQALSKFQVLQDRILAMEKTTDDQGEHLAKLELDSKNFKLTLATKDEVNDAKTQLSNQITATDNEFGVKLQDAKTAITNEFKVTTDGLEQELVKFKDYGLYTAYCNDNTTFDGFTTDDPNANQTLSITVDGVETSGEYPVKTMSQTEFLAVINGEMEGSETGNGYRYIGFASVKNAKPSEYKWILSSDYAQQFTLSKVESLEDLFHVVEETSNTNKQNIADMSVTSEQFKVSLSTLEDGQDDLTAQLELTAKNFNVSVAQAAEYSDGKPNLLMNSNARYLKDITGWKTVGGVRSSITFKIEANPTVEAFFQVNSKDAYIGDYTALKSTLTGSQNISFSAKIYSQTAQTVTIMGCGWKADGSGWVVSADRDLKVGWNIIKLEKCAFSDTAGVELRIFTKLANTYLYPEWLKAEVGDVATAWIANPEDPLSTGDLMAKINLEAGHALFTVGDNVLNITPTTTFIEDSTITRAMIHEAAIDRTKIADATITTAEIDYLDGYKIVANSITAEQLAVNAIQVGINNMSDVIKISPYELAFYSNGTKSASLDESGLDFWYGTRKIGRMGEQQKLGNPNVRGVSMNIESTGDYIAWGYRQQESDDAFTTMLTLDPRGLFTGRGAAIYADDLPLIVNKIGSTNNALFKISSTTIAGAPAAFIGNEYGTQGIAINGNGLFQIAAGTYHNLYYAAKLGEYFHNIGSFAIPQNFNANGGGATKWWNYTL